MYMNIDVKLMVHSLNDDRLSDMYEIVMAEREARKDQFVTSSKQRPRVKPKGKKNAK